MSLSLEILKAVVALIAVSLTAILMYFKWQFTYWKRRNLQVLPPTIPYGNTKEFALKKIDINTQMGDIYQELKKKNVKHVGIYMFTKPIYVPMDPELIKTILIKDFDNFVNRGIEIDHESSPLAGHLVNLEDKKWKHFRAKLSPTFTSGKMKMMFKTIVDCASGLIALMDDASEKGKVLDIKDILARFTTDVISSCAFGIECNSLENPDALIRQKGRMMFQSAPQDFWRRIIRNVVPKKLSAMFGFKFFDKDIEDFFVQIITDTIEMREKSGIIRKDFVHLLIQLKNKGEVEEDLEDEKNPSSDKSKFTMKEIIPQAFLFFTAGFESSPATMMMVLFELALNPTVQDESRKEIRQIFARHQDQLTYDSLGEMTYLDAVINEALRKHQSNVLSRVAKEDYRIPGSDVILEKGTKVFVLTRGLHYDPEFYPNPEKFDPNRFTADNKQSRPPCTWLGFGEGPRMCIGSRFAMIQMKVGLATILRNYQFSLNDRTIMPLKMDVNTQVPQPVGGIWLNVVKID